MTAWRDGYCSALRVSGYWKGSPCCARGCWQTHDGRLWCQYHVPMNQAVEPTPARKRRRKK